MKKMVIHDDRKLLRVEIYKSGNVWSLQYPGGVKTFQGSVEDFARLLKSVQASDNNKEPRSYRSERYLDMANNIADGKERVFWIWKHKIRKVM